MSKSPLILFVMIFTIACGQTGTSNKESNEQPIKEATSIQSASTKKEEILAQKANEVEEKDAPINQFARTTYFVTGDYDLENCKALSRCDCCLSEIAFLDDTNYVYMFSCEASTYFLKGAYIQDSSRLTLKHDSILVADEHPMFEDESDTTQYGIFVHQQFNKLLEFEISECQDRTLISTVNSSNKDHGTHGTQSSWLRQILSDPNSEIVQKLEIE